MRPLIVTALGLSQYHGLWLLGLTVPTSHAIFAKAARLKLFGRSPAGFYLRLIGRIWKTIPLGLRNFYLIRAYAAWLYGSICLLAPRQQYFGTFFLRNRPALDLMRSLAECAESGLMGTHGPVRRVNTN